MNNPDYKYVFTTNVPPEEAIDAISRVNEWWTTDFDGSSRRLDDIFTVHFGDVSVNFKIIEFVPDKKVVWLVTDCDLTWLKDRKEWKNTMLKWEVYSGHDATKVRMTHVGLVPGMECYDDCSKGWNFHVGESLFKLITQGVGEPGVNTRQRVN